MLSLCFIPTLYMLICSINDTFFPPVGCRLTTFTPLLTLDETAAALQLSNGQCYGTRTMRWNKWDGRAWNYETATSFNYEYENNYLKLKVIK